jgi:hypothetical protein
VTHATDELEHAVNPGDLDLQALMQQAQQMQQQLMTAQAELATAEVTGQAGNGLVQVRMTAAGQVQSVRVDPSVVDPEDVETLQDLLVGALHDAARAAQALQAEKMGPLAGGLGGMGGGLGLPGA